MPVAEEFIPHSVEPGAGPLLHSGVGSARAGVVESAPANAIGAATTRRVKVLRMVGPFQMFEPVITVILWR